MGREVVRGLCGGVGVGGVVVVEEEEGVGEVGISSSNS